MLFIPTGNRAYVLQKRKRTSGSNSASVIGRGSGDPFDLPSLINRFEIASIIPYDGNPGVPQAQWIDTTVTASDLYRATCAPAPCVPPHLTTVTIGGHDFAIMNDPFNQFGVGSSHINPDAGKKILKGATSFTVMTYIKDIGAIAAKHRWILYLNSNIPGTVAPYFRFGIISGARNLYTNVNDSHGTNLFYTDAGDYSINGSIICVTLDATIGKLSTYTVFGTDTITNGAWVPTQFTGLATWFHSIFACGDAAVYFGFDGYTSSWYFYNDVLSNTMINKLAAYLAMNFGLTLPNVWTPI